MILSLSQNGYARRESNVEDTPILRALVRRLNVRFIGRGGWYLNMRETPSWAWHRPWNIARLAAEVFDRPQEIAKGETK